MAPGPIACLAPSQVSAPSTAEVSPHSRHVPASEALRCRRAPRGARSRGRTTFRARRRGRIQLSPARRRRLGVARGAEPLKGRPFRGMGRQKALPGHRRARLTARWNRRRGLEATAHSVGKTIGPFRASRREDVLGGVPWLVGIRDKVRVRWCRILGGVEGQFAVAPHRRVSSVRASGAIPTPSGRCVRSPEARATQIEASGSPIRRPSPRCARSESGREAVFG